MHITSSELIDFDEDKLMIFIEKKIPEGLYLDYKEDLSGGEENQRKEFLKDVTSFANANGGDILIGVKEPEDDIEVAEQVVGVNNGKDIAEVLERLVTSGAIDPRIPGLCIKPIPLTEDKAVILVHIPPSLGRPHMVNYKKHRGFYIRNWESSNPMTTFDIKQAVLTSASAEGKALSYLQEREEDAKQYFIGTHRAFLMQAMPIIPPEVNLEVLSPEIYKVLQDSCRSKQYFSLQCFPCPRPTIFGVQGTARHDDPFYFINFHRNGYIEVIYLLDEGAVTPNGKNEPVPALNPYFSTLFTAFGELCNDLLQVSGFDSSFILRNQYFNAQGTVFDTGGIVRSLKPYIKNVLSWPDQVRQTGEDFTTIMDEWKKQMFYAFGKTPAQN